MKKYILALLALTLCLTPRAAVASDHADPIKSKDPGAGITGLFAFPVDDRMVLMLNVRPRTMTAPPYELEEYEYSIHMDFHTPVRFNNEADLKRYGGTIDDPAGIRADASLTFRLTNDATLREKTIEGLTGQSDIRIEVGVFDDPFIFPRFEKKNVVAIAVSIPTNSFPSNQQTMLIWGTTTKGGKQIDHVGRSNRTQLARFDFLNKLPPNEHVPAIHAKAEKGRSIYGFLMDTLAPAADLFQLLLKIRHYDQVADVMIYTTQQPPGFPNGRRLEDDIVGITCQFGECALQETAFIESETFPRRVINDRPFQAEFPYLAPAWSPQEAHEEEAKSSSWKGWVIALVVLLVVIAVWRFLKWWL